MNSPPSIVPDYSDSGGGGGGGVQSITAGNAGISITGTITDPIISNSGVNTITATNAGAGITITGTPTIPIISSVVGSFRPSFTIYVSPNGNDSTGVGSSFSPFLTIARALVLRGTISPDNDVEIILYAGNYPENVVITVANTTITAYPSAYDTGQTSSKAVSITGNITVDIQTLGTQGAGSVAFTGINIISSSIVTGSSANQGLYFRLTNCKTQGFILNNQTSTQVYTAQYSDCYMIHTADSCVITGVGVDIAIIRCDILHTNALTQPTINLQNGNTRGGTLNMQYSKVISTTSSATAKPIIRYQNVSSTTGNLILYNTLSYTSQTVDTGFDKCCIQFNSTGATTFDLMTFNGFDCDGAKYTGGQPYAIQQRGAGAVTINVWGGNYGGVQAHRIDPAITRISNMILSA